MAQKRLTKVFFYAVLFIIICSVSFAYFSKRVSAAEPIIEKIFSYQPESDRGILQTVVFGKNLDDLELEFEKCPSISVMPFEDNVIFTCQFQEEGFSRNFSARLITPEGNIIREFTGALIPKKDFDQIVKPHETILYRASGILEYTGKGTFSVYGQNLPSSLTIDADCEDSVLPQEGNSSSHMSFYCHKKSDRGMNEGFNSFLVKESTSGNIFFHELKRTSEYFHIPTVHVTPFFMDERRFYEIFIYSLWEPETWKNEVVIKAEFCNNIWYIPRLFDPNSEWGPGESFLCEAKEGVPASADEVRISYKTTGTLLWPVNNDENKGFSIFRKDKTVTTGKYLRSLNPPPIPSVSITMKMDTMGVMVQSSSEESPDFKLAASFCSGIEKKIVENTEEFWKGIKYWNTEFTCILDPSKKSDGEWMKVSDKNGIVVYQDFPYNTKANYIKSLHVFAPSKGYEIDIIKSGFIFYASLFSPFCRTIEDVRSYPDEYDCVPKEGHVFDLDDMIIVNETDNKVYWPIDASKGPSMPLDQFLRERGLKEIFYSSIIDTFEASQNRDSEFVRIKITGHNLSPEKVKAVMKGCKNLEAVRVLRSNFELKYDCFMGEAESGFYGLQLLDYQGKILLEKTVEYRSPYESEYTKKISRKRTINKLKTREKTKKEIKSAKFNPKITKIQVVQSKENQHHLSISIEGEDLPEGIATFVPDCAGMKKIKQTDSSAKFACTFPDSAFSGKYEGIVKTKKGGEKLENGDFTVAYLAPASYALRFLYPHEKEKFTVQKNDTEESFVYLEIEHLNGFEKDFSISYQLGGKIQVQKGENPFSIVIPPAFTKGVLKILKINDSTDFLGGKNEIVIEEHDPFSANLTFSHDRAIGMKARLNPITAVGTDSSIGGKLEFSIPYERNKNNRKEKELPLHIGIQKGKNGQFEISIPLQTKAFAAGIAAEAGFMDEQNYGFQYRNFEDFITEKNMDPFKRILPSFITARKNFESTFKSCNPEIFQNQRNGIYFVPHCGFLDTVWGQKYKKEYEEAQSIFEKVAAPLEQQLSLDKEMFRKNLIAFLLLKEGFRIKGEDIFTQWLRLLLKHPEIKLAHKEFEELLDSMKRNDSELFKVKMKAEIGLESMIDAKLGGEISTLKKNTIYHVHQDGFTSSKMRDQGMSVHANVSSSLASRALKKISQKTFTKFLEKMLVALKDLGPTKLDEKMLCRAFKIMLGKKGMISDETNKYADDCRGLSSVLNSGFSATLQFSFEDFKKIFQELFQINLSDSLAEAITLFFTGQEVNLLGVLTDYPLHTSYAVTEFYNAQNIKKVIFTISSEKNTSGGDEGSIDEYVFTSSDVLPPANFSMFVEKEFERYLELAAENPSINLLVNRYRLIPEEEQNISLSLGWGLSLKLSESAGHEVRVLTEQYGYTADRKPVKISETEKSFLDKTLQHLRKLASPESDQNAHFKTIFSNLYNVVYIGTSHYDFADVSKKASKSISVGQIY